MINSVMINPATTENAGVIIKQVYAPLALMASLTVGITFTLLLILGEKKKKILRVLLVSPASFSDILIEKLLVVMVFQVAMTCTVMAILEQFTGTIPLVLLYIMLGAIFGLSLGLLFGSLFNSVQSASTISG